MSSDMSFLQQQLHARPWWMNVLFAWSTILAIAVPIELITRRVAEDVEVWFDFELMGWSAKASGLLHVIIFAAGTSGFSKMRAWMWPWAAVYVAQVALSHLVWSELSPNGNGWPIGLLQAIGISIVIFLLLQAKPLFQDIETLSPSPMSQGGSSRPTLFIFP